MQIMRRLKMTFSDGGLLFMRFTNVCTSSNKTTCVPHTQHCEMTGLVVCDGKVELDWSGDRSSAVEVE